MTPRFKIGETVQPYAKKKRKLAKVVDVKFQNGKYFYSLIYDDTGEKSQQEERWLHKPYSR